jgi:hypothetical protein
MHLVQQGRQWLNLVNHDTRGRSSGQFLSNPLGTLAQGEKAGGVQQIILKN